MQLEVPLIFQMVAVSRQAAVAVGLLRVLPLILPRVEDAQSDMLDALTLASEGGKSDKAKPFKGVDGGVFEIALKYRGDAFRTLYAVKIRRGYLGHPRFSEEIKVRYQNTTDGS